MPFSDDVGGRGQEARGLEEASTEVGRLPCSVQTNQSGDSIDQPGIDATTAERITRFAADDWERVVGVVGYVCGSDVDGPSAVSESICQIRQTNSEGRAYFEKRMAEGKTKMEAIRSLKRHVSNAVYRQLLIDAQK
jgi:hypothetical protein